MLDERVDSFSELARDVKVYLNFEAFIRCGDKRVIETLFVLDGTETQGVDQTVEAIKSATGIPVVAVQETIYIFSNKVKRG